jgi:hypothetical protein
LRRTLTAAIAAGCVSLASAAPPAPIVEMRFEEGSGIEAANTGTLTGSAVFAQWDELPAFTTSVPQGPYAPASNNSAVDMGAIGEGQGGRAIDLITGIDGTLGALNAFTICGWVNARDLRIGAGGNRVAFALESPNGNGFDLVQLSNGSFRLGVNQWPDGANGGGPSSSAGMLTEDPEAGPDNWVFFAVTYDPELESGNVKYYFGRGDALARLDSQHNYRGGVQNGGIIEYTGPLTLGNFGYNVAARDATGPGASRMFRGLIDEFKVYDQALSLEDLHWAQLNGEPPPTPVELTQQPASQTVFAGEPVTFTAQAVGSAPLSYRWQRDGADIPGADTPSLTLQSVTVADDLAEFRAIVTNPLNSVTSAPAILRVMEGTDRRIAVSFTESIGNVTTNWGDLGGQGTFVVQDGYPVFSSAVPSGAWAPTENVASVDFGPIDEGQGGRAIDFSNNYGNTLRTLTAFTVTGWVNSRDLREGFGGNRIAFALASPNGPGFDLVQLSSGALRIGINQWPDGANGGGPQSTEGRITEDPELGAGNWVYFAVTYDPSLETGHVKYYFGSPSEPAALDVEADYNQGDVAVNGPLTIGNFGAVVAARNEVGPNGGSRVFRGLIDELNVFSRALSLEEIRQQQRAPAFRPQAEPTIITRAPASRTAFEGENVTFDVEFTGTPPFTFAWLRNGQPIPGATAATYTLDAVTLAENGAEFQVVISSDQGSVTSAPPARLTVLPEDHLKIHLAFEESSGETTLNRGNLGGTAVFAAANGFPQFSSNVPAGELAPSGNRSSIDFGSIDENQGGQALDLTTDIDGTVGPLTAFTISGWLNARDLRVGAGGNRIAFALAAPNGPGFDLVQLASGALRIGINQWPDGANGGGPQSSDGMIPEDPAAGVDNWVFFAVTYDSAAEFGHVSYYFGSGSQPATLDYQADYDRGPIVTSGPLTVGNFGSVVAARTALGPSGSRVFRGLIDELRVHNRALSPEEIVALQSAAPPVAAPRLSITQSGADLVVSWPAAAGFRLQSTAALGTAPWTDAPEQPATEGGQTTVRVTPGEGARFFRLAE